MAFATLGQIRASIAKGERSAEEATLETFERIHSLESQLNAFVTVDEAGALEAARAVDQKRAHGESLGPLAGVPVGVKDQIVTRELPTTCGSRILEDFEPTYDAHVVERLRAADAIIVGKLNLDEFAMGSTGEFSSFGPTRNPWNLDHVAGGSSSGSAAAVAADQCVVSLGTDTGGSVREPAAFCGVVGLKPTYGRVSRRGIVAFASSLDQCGPLARNVRDCATLLGVIAGRDAGDATSLDRPVPDYASLLEPEVAGLRVGVPSAFFGEGVDSEVASCVREALDVLVQAGAKLVPLELSLARYAVPTYALLANAEASSNLARFDGVRYGRRASLGEGDGLDDLYERSRGEGFGPEVKRRIMLGTHALSSGHYEAYYGRAQRVRTLIRDEITRLLDRVDVIAGPTTPMPAVLLGSRIDDPVQMLLLDMFTVSANLTGLPALSLPCGFTSAGLPVGLHLVGPAFAEQRLLDVGLAYEERTAWHERHPKLSGGVS